MAALEYPDFEIFKGNSSIDTLTDGKYGGGRGDDLVAAQKASKLRRQMSVRRRQSSTGSRRSSGSATHIVTTVGEAETAIGELMDNIEVVK